MTAEVVVHVTPSWTEPGRYDTRRELPCVVCQGPTRLRTRRDLPCHPACFGQMVERELVGRARVLLESEDLPVLPVASLPPIGGAR